MKRFFKEIENPFIYEGIFVWLSSCNDVGKQSLDEQNDNLFTIIKLFDFLPSSFLN